MIGMKMTMKFSEFYTALDVLVVSGCEQFLVFFFLYAWQKIDLNFVLVSCYVEQRFFFIHLFLNCDFLSLKYFEINDCDEDEHEILTISYNEWFTLFCFLLWPFYFIAEPLCEYDCPSL